MTFTVDTPFADCFDYFLDGVIVERFVCEADPDAGFMEVMVDAGDGYPLVHEGDVVRVIRRGKVTIAFKNAVSESERIRITRFFADESIDLTPWMPAKPNTAAADALMGIFGMKRA